MPCRSRHRSKPLISLFLSATPGILYWWKLTFPALLQRYTRHPGVAGLQLARLWPHARPQWPLEAAIAASQLSIQSGAETARGKRDKLVCNVSVSRHGAIADYDYMYLSGRPQHAVPHHDGLLRVLKFWVPGHHGMGYDCCGVGSLWLLCYRGTVRTTMQQSAFCKGQ